MNLPHGLEPHHRVTALSLHSSNALSGQFAVVLTSLIRMPFESIFLRSLARSFLATRTPASSSLWLRGQVHPLSTWFGPGFRLYGWRGVLAYSSKILLCMGLDLVIGLEVWRIGYQAAWWAGFNWFNWGRL